MTSQVTIEYLENFVKETDFYLDIEFLTEMEKIFNQVTGVPWRDSRSEIFFQALEKIDDDVLKAQMLAIECRDFMKERMKDFKNCC